jgi:DNA-binding beta-propeller fold protein YncE
MDMDTLTRRVFVAALGNNTVEVVDLRMGRRIRSLSGFNEPQGVLFLPKQNRLLVTNGGTGLISILHGSSLTPIRNVKSGDDADNIRYDPSAGLVYAGCGSGALAIIDPEKGEKIGDIRLPGHPESFQLELSGGAIYVNTPSSKSIVVLDRQRRQIVFTWAVKNAAMNFPMAYDAQHRLLLVGFRRPPSLQRIDLQTGAVAESEPIGGDVDDVFVDRSRRLVFATCGEGVVDVFSFAAGDSLRRVQTVQSRRGARTSLYVPTLRMLLVAAPRSGRSDATLLLYVVGE